MGPPIFPNITKDKISLRPGEKTCSFISWGGIILDLGGNFSKYIDRRRHLDTSHQGTWSGSALIYLLTRRLIKRIENRKPPKGLVKRIFQEIEQKVAFVLFYYFNYGFIFLDITFVGFAPAIMLKLFLSHFLILFGPLPYGEKGSYDFTTVSMSVWQYVSR